MVTDFMCAVHKIVSLSMQAQWPEDSPLLSLPGMTADAAAALGRLGLATLPTLAQALGGRQQQDTRRQLSQLLGSHVSHPNCVARGPMTVDSRYKLGLSTCGIGLGKHRCRFDGKYRNFTRLSHQSL